MSKSVLRCRIHRGCHEIGGNCVELDTEGQRIVLDVGLPLNDTCDVELPDIQGLKVADPSLLGIFISHPHPDHYGLLERLTTRVPVYIGEASLKIINAGSFFAPLPSLVNLHPQLFFDQQPTHLGPFTITPLRIDHSAFDSYCLLIEANGKRLLYSGDFRGHGRHAHLFENMTANPPEQIDVLICEGTQIGRVPDFAYPDEAAVANELEAVMNETPGMTLIWCSSQNIDRISSIWQACQGAGRQLILDMYTAEILKATGDPDLPTPADEGVKVFLPHTQKLRIVRERAFHIPRQYYPHRIYPEKLSEWASRSAMTFRPSMLPDLQKEDCLDGASLVTSLWSGYVHRSHQMMTQIDELGIKRYHIHTSGHATEEELRRFINAIAAKRVIPIHLQNREGFASLAPNVELKNDLEWWEV